MRLHRHPRTALIAALGVALGLAVAGCGSSSSPSIPASGVLVNQTATSPGQIILTKLGADRIGLQTVPVRTGSAAHTVAIPYSAIIYDPSGKTYAFTNVRPLTYVEVPVAVDHISGNTAFLSSGPKAGAKVVSVGAEELYGVQTGVLAQT
jgi:multidrug efflux pump subunit AcrA (membrane-fusion protein)